MSFQTPGGHDAKRRRIEAANATLRKPFRSPLVNRQQHETPGPAATDSVTPHTPAPARGSRHASNTAPPLSTSPTLTPWSLQPKEQAAATAATKSLTPRPGRTPLPIKNQATPRPQPQQRPRPGSQCTKRGGAPATATTATQPAQGVKEELQKEPGEDEEEDDEDLLTRLTTAQRTLHSHLRAAQSRLALVRQAAQIERRASSSATERPGEPAGVDLTGLIGKCKSPFFRLLALISLLRLTWGWAYYTLHYSRHGRISSSIPWEGGCIPLPCGCIVFFFPLCVVLQQLPPRIG